MPTIRTFEELEVWKEARVLSFQIFQFTLTEPVCHDFKFRDQIRSAAGSVMDNIAEGFERSGRLEFINFLGFAKGSAGEVRSQLYRALDQQYISDDVFKVLHDKFERLGKQIAAFIAYLNKSEIRGEKFRNRTRAK